MSPSDRKVKNLSAVPAALRSFPSGLLLDPASSADQSVHHPLNRLKKAFTLASFADFLV